MGKHAKIEPDQKVASVFVPISRTGLPNNCEVTNGGRIF